VEPFGEEVVQRIKAEGVVCIRGNHERWALERRRRRPDPRRSAPSIVEPADLLYPLYGPRLSEPPRVAHCWVHGKCEDVAQTDRRIPRERAECREIC
jgi:hypothetical protein